MVKVALFDIELPPTGMVYQAYDPVDPLAVRVAVLPGHITIPDADGGCGAGVILTVTGTRPLVQPPFDAAT